MGSTSTANPPTDSPVARARVWRRLVAHDQGGYVMRRTLVLMVLAAVAASALTAGATAIGFGSGGLAQPTTIHVIEHPVTDQVIDIGAPGDSPGDQLPFANPVFNASNSSRVGSDQGNCVRASASQGRWECMWTTFLSRGQITVEGPFRDAFPTTALAVTGGTGAYRNARGVMVLHARADGNFDFVFHLQP
jgi:Allene oxide cyclase